MKPTTIALALSLGGFLAGQQPAPNSAAAPVSNDPSQNVRIQGTVTSVAGDPIRQPTVRLEAIGATQAQLSNAYSATGDASGKFTIANVPPGRYTLTASKAGFITQRYGARSFTSAGATISANAGQDVKDLSIKLTPQGVITGKITDEDGDPVRGVSVSGFRTTYDRNGRRFMQTGAGQSNDLGEFRIQGLAPGRYYLMAEPVGEIAGLAPGHRMTYYPNGLDSSSAVAIDVAAGAEVQGMDIRLRREKSYSIRGRAIDSSTGAAAANAILQWSYKGARSEPLPRIIYRVRDDGSFTIRGLLPATYVIEVLPGGAVSAGQTLTLGLSGKIEANISDSNIENIVFPLSAGADISGTFRLEDGDIQAIAQSGTRPSIHLISPEGAITVPNRMKDDGTFKLDRVGTGQYFLDVAGLPSGTYVKSARYGVRDVIHSTLEVAAGSSSIDVVLSPKAAQVNGTVRDSDGAPLPGITVSVWPKTPDLGNQTRGVRTAVSDQNGNFQVGNLPPDEYYAVAFDDIDPNLALFSDFLAHFNGDATPLRLAESATGAVDVKIIPTSRIVTELTKLANPPGPAIGASREESSRDKSTRETPSPLSGRVLDLKGEPIKKATVRISASDSYLGQTTTISDANGVYAFEDVPPGVYELSAEKSGFLTQKLGAVAPGPIAQGAKLNLKPGERLQDQNFKLIAQGVIAGRVINQMGQPQPNTGVSAAAFDYVQGHRRLRSLSSGTSDGQGNYRIANVVPGHYYLMTSPAGPAAIFAALDRGANTPSGPDSPVKTFYPSATEVSNAVAIDVAPGAELRGMDIQVRTARTFSIKGKVIAASGSGPLNEQFLTLRPKDRDDMTLDSAATRPSNDGAFELLNIRPGAYTLLAGLTRLGNTFAAPTLFALQDVTVTDTNVDDLVLSLTPGFRVTGTVSIDGGNAHPRPPVRLVEPESGTGYAAQSSFRDDGTFEMKDVAPGRYQLQTNLPTGTYIESARIAGQDAIHGLLDLTTSPSAPLEILLSPKVAEISGTVKNASGEPASNTLVVLWPKTPQAGLSNGNIRSVGTDLKGGFLLNDVAPGEYFAAAMEQLEPGLAQSSEFLSHFNGVASEVSLNPGSRVSADPRFISREKIDAELKDR